MSARRRGARPAPAVGVICGRRNGKTSAQRREILEAAHRGDHVHYLGTGGGWGIQMTDLGVLWVRLRPGVLAGQARRR
jgi:hypothetical protein